MQVVVEFTAQFKQAAQKASQAVDVPEGTTMQSVLQSVANDLGDPLKSLLLNADSNLHASILVFVQDEQAHWNEDHALSDGDTITLLAPISGG